MRKVKYSRCGDKFLGDANSARMLSAREKEKDLYTRPRSLLVRSLNLLESRSSSNKDLDCTAVRRLLHFAKSG